MSQFFSEIRRRRVLRTTIYYLAGAWLIIEVVSTIAPAVHLPEWSPTLVIIVLAVGFPIAVVLSWVFDISPSVIKTPFIDETYQLGASAALTAHPNSIAVLPFVNMSGDPENEYFSDGISEELLNLLAKQPEMKVAARTSSFAFKKKDVDIPTIAHLLGVKTVLEGSVRRVGNRVRITGQLVEAQTGYHLWSDTYDRLLEDIFAVQDQIATAIVDALKRSLGLEQEVREPPPPIQERPPTNSVEAYQHYLRGRYLWAPRGESAILGAIDAFGKAIVLDTQFAKAYASLAAAHAVLHEYSGQPREPDFEKAEPLAHKAIELDPMLAEPHAVLGYINLRRWRWDESETAFMNALSMDPNDPLGHQWFSNLLNDLGRRDEASREALKAYELDRVSPMANNVLALSYGLAGETETALKHTAIAREFGVGGLVPDYVDFFSQLRNCEYDEAIATWEGTLLRLGNDSTWVRPVIEAIEDESRLSDAVQALDKAHGDNTISRHALFLQYVLLGQPGLTFDFAETQLDDHSLIHVWLFLPEAEPLRKHPRFLDLMKIMGLVDYWEHHGWPDFIPSPSQS